MNWLQRPNPSSLAILLIGVTVTVIVWFVFLDFIEESYQHSFLDESKLIIQKTESRLQVYNGVLLGAVGLFAASEEVTPEEWGIFIKSTKLIETFPGIQGVGYNKYISGESEKMDLVDQMEEYGIENYQIKPEGIRAEYFPVVYIFPENEENLRAIGYDIYSEEIRLDAVNNVIATNEMSITGKITLVQEGDTDIQNGFLMLIPIFDGEEQQKIMGLISAVFRVDDLMFAIIDNESFENKNIRFYDSVESLDTLFFDSNKKFQVPDSDEGYSFRDSINFGNKEWVFVVQGKQPELSNSDRNILIIIPVIGVGMSILGLIAFSNFNKNVVAKQIQKRRDEFDSMISHELKTPLVPIVGYCDLLLAPDLLGKLNDEQLNAVNKIVTNTDHIRRLIENILDSQKLALGKFNLQYSTVNFREFVLEIVNSHQSILSEKNISLSMEHVPSIQVKMDALRIKEVFTNIIQNAVDFVPKHNGKISINAEDLKGKIRVSISNNGSMIPHKQLSEIFKKFHQVDSGETRKHGGSGLGLAICKGIVELHGGKIWAESDPYKTSFIFEIYSNPN